MLVIDGNSVYEIDEECIKKRGISKYCGIDGKWTERKETIQRRGESDADFQDQE